MKKVIGVRFRTAGKIYFFDPGKLSVKRNDHVIVETARGIEYGVLPQSGMMSRRLVISLKKKRPLRSALRRSKNMVLK